MKTLKRPVSLLTFILLAAAGLASAAQIQVVTMVGSWRDPQFNTTSQGTSSISNGDPTSSINWGGTVAQSGYDFTKSIPGIQTLPPAPTPLFSLGNFTHRNEDLTVNQSQRTLQNVKLDLVVTLNVDGTPVGPLTFTYTFTHDETSNSPSTISQCDPNKVNPTSTYPCPDVVTITASPNPTTFNVGGVDYTLALSFVNGQGNPVSRFITEERQTNMANLVGQFMLPPPPPSCGDGICNGSDTCSNCSQDCGICPVPPPPTLPLHHIRVTPSSATLGIGTSWDFSAQGYNINDVLIPGLLFNWAITGSNPLSPASGSATTTVTAGITPGIYTLTATNSGISGQAIVAVQGGGTQGALYLIDPASASPNPVPGTQTHLHVLAGSTNPGPISYRWDYVGLAATITNPNSPDADATFTQPGNYQFKVTITDGAGLQLLAHVNVPVNRTVTRVVVNPAVAVATVGQSFPFTAQAFDQWNQPLASGFAWGASAGTINAVGSFSASAPMQNITITATAPNGVSGTARMSVSGAAVASMDLSNAKAYPVPYKATAGVPGITFTGLTPDTRIRIYSSDGRLVQTLFSWGPNVIWDTTNKDREKLASGVYFYQIDNPAGSEKEGKLVIIQ